MKDTILLGESYTLAIAAETNLFVQARILSVSDIDAIPVTLNLTALSTSVGGHLPVYSGVFTPTTIGTYLVTFIIGATEQEAKTAGVGRLSVEEVSPRVSVAPTGAPGASTTIAVIDSKQGVLSFASTSE